MRPSQEQLTMSNVLSTDRTTHSEPRAPKLLHSLFSRPPFSGWERAMFRDVAKELAILFGAVLVVAAIIVFRTWMWFPQTQG
jgi:hypothetical protein